MAVLHRRRERRERAQQGLFVFRGGIPEVEEFIRKFHK
jgi:hypothetical protein